MTTASADQTTVFATNVVQISCAVLGAGAVAVRPYVLRQWSFFFQTGADAVLHRVNI